MVHAYRLTELGFALPAGTALLSPEAFAPVPAATALLEAAEARAAAIVAEAEEAYRRREDDGYRDGMERARVDTMARLLAETATLDAQLRAVDHDLSEVVVLCVRKLVAEFDDFARARSAVRAALRQMRREKRAELRVPTALVARFKAALDEILAEFPEVELVDVVEDPTLQPPKIVLETAVGRVEADMAARLGDLEAMVRAAALPPRDEVAARDGVAPRDEVAP